MLIVFVMSTRINSKVQQTTWLKSSLCVVDLFVHVNQIIDVPYAFRTLQQYYLSCQPGLMLRTLEY